MGGGVWGIRAMPERKRFFAVDVFPKVDWVWSVFPTMRTGFIRLYTFAGSSVSMPEELMELYNLYQQELHTRQVLEIINGALCRCGSKTEIWPFLPFFLVIKEDIDIMPSDC